MVGFPPQLIFVLFFCKELSPRFLGSTCTNHKLQKHQGVCSLSAVLTIRVSQLREQGAQLHSTTDSVLSKVGLTEGHVEVCKTQLQAFLGMLLLERGFVKFQVGQNELSFRGLMYHSAYKQHSCVLKFCLESRSCVWCFFFSDW